MGLLDFENSVFETTCPKRGHVPATTYRFRPLMHEGASAYLDEAGRSAKHRTAAQAKLLTERIVGIVEAEGKVTPLDKDAIRGLPLPLVSHMVDAILCYGTDEATLVPA